MKKIIPVMFSALLSVSGLHADQPSAQSVSASYGNPRQVDWCESYSESIRKAKRDNKPLLILFTGTSWCPACMKLERDVLRKPEFAQGIADKFIFYKAEFTTPSEEGMMQSPDKVLVDRYQVQVFPTIVVVNSDGQLLYKVAYRPAGPSSYVNELLQKLNQTRR